MIGRILAWGFLVALAAVVVTSIPDIARYLRLRQM
jgi:hypothetical protein